MSHQTITAGAEGERGSVEPPGSIEDEEKEGEGEGEGETRETVEESNGGSEGDDEHDQLQQQEEGREEDEKPSPQPSTEFVSSAVISAASRQRQGTLAPYGLPCVRELLRFLVSIINIRER